MRITANRDTFLKKSTSAAQTLPDKEKRLVKRGDQISFGKRLSEKEGHVQVRLSYGAGDWWYFKEHFASVPPRVKEVKQSVPSKKSEEIQIPVPYYSQRDNYTNPHGTCFSSVCAMLLSHLKPGKIRGDDDYLRTVVWLGGARGTVNPDVQVQALEHHGLEVQYSQNLAWTEINRQLENRKPVPIGILHQGHVSNPGGFGHWIIVIGVSADQTRYLVHDPYGDLDLINGEYVSTNGRTKWYSKQNLDPRWRVKGSGGWGIIA
ncbi:C39 family peptidase [Leptolyngbya sp. AN03gr2]|uniref:C39 family peptidase n=1 Tax=Leptolyngbya sp. AN03gr2 TaxID=3423364 RepID=UPI003D31537D